MRKRISSGRAKLLKVFLYPLGLLFSLFIMATGYIGFETQIPAQHVSAFRFYTFILGLVGLISTLYRWGIVEVEMDESALYLQQGKDWCRVPFSEIESVSGGWIVGRNTFPVRVKIKGAGVVKFNPDPAIAGILKRPSMFTVPIVSELKDKIALRP